MPHASSRTLVQARTLNQRALSNAPVIVLLVALLAPACEHKTEAAVEPGSPRAQIKELVETFRPLDRTVTSDVEDAKFVKERKLLDRCSNGGVEVGRAALDALRENTERNVPIEFALLTVAAHAATADTVPLLENLIQSYGAHMELRTEAVRLIAEVAPERAIAVLEPLVKQQKQTSTMPDMEFIVSAWIVACQGVKRSPVPELCDVATNIFQPTRPRVVAVRELGNHKDPRGEAALRTILVESTGDGYVRRITVQSLHTLLPAETACTLFREVRSKEADLNMLKFLEDVLDKWCPDAPPK